MPDAGGVQEGTQVEAQRQYSSGVESERYEPAQDEGVVAVLEYSAPATQSGPAARSLPRLSQEQESAVANVLGIARRFAGHWADAFTVNIVDDLAQQTTIETLVRYHQMLDRACLPGFIRTIARRLRFRELAQARRRNQVLQTRAELLAFRDRSAAPRALRVRSRWIDRDVLLCWLDEALARLAPLNAQLLREFYGGATCRDLAARHRMAPDTVKVRLYRSRERVRLTLERRATLQRS